MCVYMLLVAQTTAMAAAIISTNFNALICVALNTNTKRNKYSSKEINRAASASKQLNAS